MASRTLIPTRAKMPTQKLAGSKETSTPGDSEQPQPPQRLTDHRQAVFGGREDVLEDQQQDGDGQQDGDLEAQLFSSDLADEEGRQVQDQQVEERHDEDGHVEKRLPDDGDLKQPGQNLVRGQVAAATGPTAAASLPCKRACSE